MELLKIEINNEWSNALPVPYGKDIIIRFSKDYCLVTMKIYGEGERFFLRTRLGASQYAIPAYLISHIKNPILTMKTEFEPSLEAVIEMKEPDLRVI